MYPRILCFTLFAAACGSSSSSPAHPESSTSKVERGRYLVSGAGCSDCHTPTVMTPKGPAWDTTRLLSGHPDSVEMPPTPALPAGPWMIVGAATGTAWSGPWGTSFTANLTPDAETGLGKWTEQNFIDTIRKARHMGTGRPLLPPMPAAVVANFSDEDLASIFAYLQSLPPIKNHVPAPRPPAAS
jgi:mono/diheme cytochrome c family protein